MKFFSKHKSGRPDYLLEIIILCLVAFGLVALSSASSDLGKIHFNDTYYYLKHQIFYGLSLGILGFIFTSRFYYKHYKKMATILLLGSILVMFAVLFTPLGVRAGGSTRWLSLGPFTIQPSELFKITFIIYLAAWLSHPGKERKHDFGKGFLPFLFLSGLVGFLLILQPATSTVIILLASALIVYFMSGAKYYYIMLIVVFLILSLVLLLYISPYRFQRLATFLSPNVDTQGAGFHLNQSLITIGSGGFYGVGFGQSTNKFNYLPESIGDSIFAVIAAEFGFIGAATLVFVFFVLLLRGFLIARGLRDEFGKLLLIGLVCVIGIQAFVNMGAISGLMPLTGVTLPFISYGGTSLAVFLTMAGIMVNISKYA